MGISTTQQAIQALYIYADAIARLDRALSDDIEILRVEFNAVKETLGPHAPEIGSIIKCVETALEVGKEPMNKMPETLRNKAHDIDVFLKTGKN